MRVAIEASSCRYPRCAWSAPSRRRPGIWSVRRRELQRVALVSERPISCELLRFGDLVHTHIRCDVISILFVSFVAPGRCQV